MRVLEMRSPPSSTGSIASARKPDCAPCACSSARSPPRAWPKRKPGPTQTSRAASRPTSVSCTKSAASIAASARLKRSRPMPSTPSARSPSILSCASISRGGFSPRANSSRGSGSKPSATAGTPNVRARATARPTSARCPRCRPSKAPMQTTLPCGHSAGPTASRNRKVMRLQKPARWRPGPSSNCVTLKYSCAATWRDQCSRNSRNRKPIASIAPA